MIDERKSMEHWWNDIDRRISKYSEKILPPGHFDYHKSNVDWPGIEAGPIQWLASTSSPEPQHILFMYEYNNGAIIHDFPKIMQPFMWESPVILLSSQAAEIYSVIRIYKQTAYTL